MPRRHRPPFDLSLDHLEPKGTSGVDAKGRRWTVRGAPVGATARVHGSRKDKARLLELVAPAPDAIEPVCPHFGTCGGCTLQQMPLARQRSEKQAMVERLVGPGEHRVHPVAGAAQALGYRNKVELSWGTAQWLPADDQETPRDGHFLGFHPAGHWGRIVPIGACALATPTMNAVLAVVQGMDLQPAYDARQHTGHWRHLVLRQDSEGVLATLVTTTEVDSETVERVGLAIAGVEGVKGVLHVVTDRLSEVAQGDVAQVLHGSSELVYTLGPAVLRLPHDAFFQVNTAGVPVLYDLIGQALGTGGTLVDLYCGVGSIGLYLAPRHERVVGVELHEGAIECARDNGPEHEWHAGAVEAVLPELPLPGDLRVVVDPPRVGLHPKAAAFLAGLQAPVLVYVACNPASLGRDRPVLEAGGWRLTDLWTVDLFPQTNHTEAVARFER